MACVLTYISRPVLSCAARVGRSADGTLWAGVSLEARLWAKSLSHLRSQPAACYGVRSQPLHQYSVSHAARGPA
eukprot:6705269-Pyramimonas_sp.AAC.1